ncbi:LysR family transcriptional regulator [Hyalangium gracile]|uniref:LysR family transcriptional regulator n=1 Tax=Hyalangium gracile TaxID=394092 RepID=UPI001CCAD1B6|nr:LysR family transcriptional regulator [Hyalangium gracile]
MEPSDLSLLATLDALLQEGSVTKAARRLGLSTPGMSHALARIRERLGDPLLVRAGRSMVLTPRAEALRPRVRSLVEEAARALEAERPFAARELERTFVVYTSDYVLTLLGPALDRVVHAEAPSVALRFVPITTDDSAPLREGAADLSIGIYGELPPEMRIRQLITDRFVCVVRKDHPTVKQRLSLDQFLQLEHVQVAPRGKPGGYIDDVLRERGQERRVVRAVPYFMTGLMLVSETDYVLTISERIARLMAPRLGLRILESPLPLRPYALQLVWHPRLDGDEAHRWLRDVLLRVSQEIASDVHPNPRTRLDPTDPTSGESRKRPPRQRS